MDSECNDKMDTEEYLCVFFNHFIELSKTQNITVNLLKNGMHRCCAFQTKEGTKGVDLIIPCFWSNSRELAGILSVQVKAIPSANQRPHKDATYLSKLLPNCFLAKKDFAEFTDKGLRSFGLVIHIRGTQTTKYQNESNARITNEDLLFKLQSYFENTEAEATFLEYLRTLKVNKLNSILTDDQAKEIKKLICKVQDTSKHDVSDIVSKKLRYLQATLWNHLTLNNLLDGEPEPYNTLNVCCHWNDSELAQNNAPLKSKIKQIVEMVEFLPRIKDPFSCAESLAFYKKQFVQIKKSLK